MISLSENLLTLFYNDHLAHSWIISSKDVCESLKEIKIFASSVLSYDICTIDSNPNFHIIERSIEDGKKAKYITIGQIRQLQSFLSTKNAENHYKIIVIYEAENMNIQASNSCLKLLEEPNKNNFLFLITKSPHIIIPTIRSRCHKITHNCDKYNDKIDDIKNDDYTNELLNCIKDNNALIKLFDSKINKEHVSALCDSAMKYVKDGLVIATTKDAIDKMLYQYDRVVDVKNKLHIYDIDPRLCLILLVEELRS